MHQFTAIITDKHTGEVVLSSRPVKAESPIAAARKVAEAYCGNDGRVELWSSLAADQIKYSVEADDELLLTITVPAGFSYYGN